MTNILEAIYNIIQNPVTELYSHYSGRNRMNNIGEALETYIKDAFANTISEKEELKKIERYNEVFSWLGNQNHPPDIMIRGGDAIEVKKIQSANSDLALNSSYPKSSVIAESRMITNECRNCEKWTEKDLIYCVGNTSDSKIKSLWLVYGDIYAAQHKTYQVIRDKIIKGINEISNVEFAETNELGRVNRLDPLGITNLRIRGMWQIQNPRKVFSYLNIKPNDNFQLVSIMSAEKYYSFSQESRIKIEKEIYEGFLIKDVRIRNSNNPAELINAKLLIFNLK